MTHSIGPSSGSWPPRAGGLSPDPKQRTHGLLGPGLALGAAAAWSGLELCRYLARKAAQDTASLQGYGYTELR